MIFYCFFKGICPITFALSKYQFSCCCFFLSKTQIAFINAWPSVSRVSQFISLIFKVFSSFRECRGWAFLFCLFDT